MVRLNVQHIDRFGDNSPDATINAEITNIRELKAHLALHHPVPIPSADQILLGARCNTLLLDGDRQLYTIRKKPGEKLEIFMYRKLIGEYVTVKVEISHHFVGVDLSDLELSFACDSTVAQLKDMIHEKRGIPPAEQLLATMGNDMETNRDMGEYILELYSQIILCKKFPVPMTERSGSRRVIYRRATYTDEETSGTTTTATEDDDEDMDEEDDEDNN